MFVYFIYEMIDPYILVIPARYAQHEILKRNYINLQICKKIFIQLNDISLQYKLKYKVTKFKVNPSRG